MKEQQERYHEYISRRFREEEANESETTDEAVESKEDVESTEEKKEEDRIATLEKKVAKIEQFIKSIEN